MKELISVLVLSLFLIFIGSQIGSIIQDLTEWKDEQTEYDQEEDSDKIA